MPKSVECACDSSEFGDLEPGDTFDFEGDGFTKTTEICTDTGKCVNSVRSDGTFWYFDCDEECEC